MKQSFESFSMSQILKRAMRQGYSISVEDTTRFSASILVNGQMKLIIGADVGLNSSASSRVSQDKLFSQYFLEKNGLHCISTQQINSGEVCSSDLEFPCIVKPNNALGGEGLTLVNSVQHLPKAIQLAGEYSLQVLLQNYIDSPEFRMVMLEGECLFAYQRRPWIIVGNGKSTIRKFIRNYNELAERRHKIPEDDQRLHMRFKQQGKNLETILGENERYQLFANANLKCGGFWEVVNNIDQQYVAVAKKAANAIGLRYAGVDIFCKSLAVFDEQYKLIEVNANPGFEFIKNKPELLNQVFDKIATALFNNS